MLELKQQVEGINGKLAVKADGETFLFGIYLRELPAAELSSVRQASS